MTRSFGFWLRASCIASALALSPPSPAFADSRQPPAAATRARIAVAGLVHGHVGRIMRLLQGRNDVELVGVFDPDETLRRQAAERYGLSPTLFFGDLEQMLDRAKPQAVATYTSTFDHPVVVEACAKRHVHVMMEKPLAVSPEHAHAIERAARSGNISVIVNYETTWYPSHAAIWSLVKERHAAGEIRKMVAMDGHEGPKEIGVGPEFLQWLTDPVKNGAGALFDFGCYGANLMTWLMENRRPLAVTAITQRIKPAIYPQVDDEANILIEYDKAQGIVQASWNWPFGRKDLEVYAERGYAIATGGNSLRVRMPGESVESTPALQPLPDERRDELAYLVGIVRGTITPSGLSSLENNLIVTEILDAARESARTGQTVRLPRK
jgi:predicted dehydrogenase